MRTTVTDSDEDGGGRVHAVLRESGIDNSPRLLAALTAFTEDIPPVPEPSPDLAALITGGVTVPLTAARFRHRVLPAALPLRHWLWEEAQRPLQARRSGTRWIR
ncbi:MAG: hypothetical protein NVS2B15_10320 [Pseudarthrobacter sp.]